MSKHRGSLYAACAFLAGSLPLTAFAIDVPDGGTCTDGDGGSTCFTVNQQGQGPAIAGSGGANGGTGVQGTSSSSNGVEGTTNSSNGVQGTTSTGPVGVSGQYTSSAPVDAGQGYGVEGTTEAPYPAAGVYGNSNANGGIGVKGQGTATGVFGTGPTGVQGLSDGLAGGFTGGLGVSGVATGTGGHAIDAICNESCATGGGYAAYFTGDVHVTGAVTGTIFNRSDARLKTDVKGASFGLQQLLQLRPVTFKWKDGSSDADQNGFIAQEVQRIVPELVQPEKQSGMLTLNYPAITLVAIRAMRDQQEIINAQSARIAALEARGRRARSASLPGRISAGAVAAVIPLALILRVRRRRRG